VNAENKTLKELFAQADRVGKKRYHRLTQQDFDDYRKYDFWRYVSGDGECGTTQESKDWVESHSDWHCPICAERYANRGGRTIDHKLPRSQYPWLSLEFKNLWVICQMCNKEKGEMHWYEYEHYMFVHHRDIYASVQGFRPSLLLKSLKE
jgi:5-methylcytosine-specific restriction endonuclease McrA